MIVGHAQIVGSPVARQTAADGPADSPPDFTVPQPLDERGLPWWFGPDYHPTEEAIRSIAEDPSAPQDGATHPSD